MENKPVSVIMSMYREDPRHLKQAVESVLNQTFSDFEFIVIADDPYNTQLINIIEDYQKKDSRIRFFINEKNMGLTYCRNKSIELCCGEYIAIMDADDICAVDRLEIQKSHFDENNDVSIVFSGRIDIDENDNITVPFKKKSYSDYNIKNMLKYCDIITNPTVMIRTKVIKHVGGLRTIVCAEDYDLWLRCVSAGVEFGYIDKPLLSYRIRSDSLSHNNYAKTWVSAKYVKSLYKQRIKTGNDTYSPENFDSFVKQSLLCNEKSTKSFNRAYDIYSNALDKIKTGNVLGSVLCFIHSILVCSEILKVFTNSVALKRCEKKQS